MAIMWYFGIFFPVLVYYAKKNLATLTKRPMIFSPQETTPSLNGPVSRTKGFG
jgi:hypothetical protein